MTLTHLDLDRIEGLAKAATPFHDGNMIRYDHGGGRLAIIPERGRGDRKLIADFFDEGDREYFAALDPTTVLAMITRIRELEGRSPRSHPSLIRPRSTQQANGQCSTRSRSLPRSQHAPAPLYRGKLHDPGCTTRPEGA